MYQNPIKLIYSIVRFVTYFVFVDHVQRIDMSVFLFYNIKICSHDHVRVAVVSWSCLIIPRSPEVALVSRLYFIFFDKQGRLISQSSLFLEIACNSLAGVSCKILITISISLLEFLTAVTRYNHHQLTLYTPKGTFFHASLLSLSNQARQP